MPLNKNVELEVRDTNAILQGKLFQYNGTQYRVEKTAMCKDATGEWYCAVIYNKYDDCSLTFCRSYKDFITKFERFKP